MPCYHPIPASQNGPGAEIRLWPTPRSEANLALPCGTCLGCRTDKATMWANRCTHEASNHQYNSFLTLTYDDEHLPAQGHLQPRDLQLFIKRLRRHAGGRSTHLNRDPKSNIRYLACGEYGTENNRPHYHALIFNGAFTDTTQVAKELTTSDSLSELWPHGHNTIGELTPAAAAYVAQYNLKKQGAGDHDADGVWRPAPFLRMSLKPAIGMEWLTKYHDDLTHGYLVQNGRKHPIPRYYRNKLKTDYPALAEQVQAQIDTHRQVPTDKKTPARLLDSEIIHQARKELMEHRKL